MNKILFIFFLFAFVVHAQQNVAIVNTEDDGEPAIGHLELNHLTDRLREIAVKTLPQRSYAVMTQQTILGFLGSQDEMAKKCKDSEGCLAKLGREINADYIAQARIGRFDGNLSIKVELYSSEKGNLVDSFNDNSSENVHDLVSVIDNKAPDLFKKIQEVSTVNMVPAIEGGISGLTSTGGYEYNSAKRYLINVNTEPQGATPSFNGMPISNCSKTPCKAELNEGSVRIISSLEQYEIADTTVSVKYNNQNISIKLKANFGVLNIESAYSDGIGNNKDWNLIINDKPYYSLGEIRLSPGNYNVKLAHNCYEDISFNVGINKGKEETVNMGKYIQLKKGGLELNAEVDGEPVSEPVYVNGKKVGETPFSDAVPICAEIKIGTEKVNVNLKHKGDVKYVHRIESKKYKEKLRLEEEKITKAKEDSLKNREWHEFSHLYAQLNFGTTLMMNSVDTLSSFVGFYGSLSLEYYNKIIGIGLNLDLIRSFADKNAIRKTYPEADKIDEYYGSTVIPELYLKLYPTTFLYFYGGTGYYFNSINSMETSDGDKISRANVQAPIFSVGTGLIGSDTFSLDVRYNIVPLKNRTTGYFSISLGFSSRGMGEEL